MTTSSGFHVLDDLNSVHPEALHPCVAAHTGCLYSYHREYTPSTDCNIHRPRMTATHSITTDNHLANIRIMAHIEHYATPIYSLIPDWSKQFWHVLDEPVCRIQWG